MITVNQIVAVSQIKLEHLIIVWTVENLEENAHLECHFKVVAVKHFKSTLTLRDKQEVTLRGWVIQSDFLVLRHPSEEVFEFCARTLIAHAKNFIAVFID